MRRLLCLVAVLLLAACSTGEAVTAPARAVDPALAPKSVVGGTLKLYENNDKATRDAFRRAGSTSLVDDGGVWELRRVDRLIGTLQISTLRSDVDLSKEETRSLIVREVIPESDERIRVAGVEVHVASTGDKTMYVWFGKRLYEVLTLKGPDGANPEMVLSDVLKHQATVPSWEPLR